MADHPESATGANRPTSTDRAEHAHSAQAAAPPLLLEAIAAEIEEFAAAGGWDTAPTLFALVPTRILLADAGAAAVIGAAPGDDVADTALTPIAQDELPEGPLDDALAQIGWPPEVEGCALSQQIVMLPPSAEASLADDLNATTAAEHPERREARLVVAVLRSGQSAAVLRLRGSGPGQDELLTGAHLAPNLVTALAATLAD